MKLFVILIIEISNKDKDFVQIPTHYYYNVDFDDGTFETYIHGKNLTPL